MKDFSQVVEEMRPLVLSILKRLNIYKNFEEYYHIGVIGLWHAYKNYKPELGSFSTFAYLYIRGYILLELSKHRQFEERVIYPDEYKLQSFIDEKGGVNGPDLCFSDILQSLSITEKRLIQLHFFDGYQLKEVANILGISYSTAKDWKKKLLEKLRRKFSN